MKRGEIVDVKIKVLAAIVIALVVCVFVLISEQHQLKKEVNQIDEGLKELVNNNSIPKSFGNQMNEMIGDNRELIREVAKLSGKKVVILPEGIYLTEMSKREKKIQQLEEEVEQLKQREVSEWAATK